MAKQFEATDEDIGASDYRAYFDSMCLRVWHLAGRERTYRIVKVTRLTSEMASGNKREIKKQPKLMLENSKGEAVPLPLLLNKTNAQTIAQLYGNNPGQWAGKLITLYPTTTSVGGAEKECIRVRNQDPSKVKRAKANKQGVNVIQQQPAPTLDHNEDMREPGADEDEPPMGALEGDDHAIQ
jgi:hypothetical protein